VESASDAPLTLRQQIEAAAKAASARLLASKPTLLPAFVGARLAATMKASQEGEHAAPAVAALAPAASAPTVEGADSEGGERSRKRRRFEQ
jgi:hypothetical protein